LLLKSPFKNLDTLLNKESFSTSTETKDISGMTLSLFGCGDESIFGVVLDWWVSAIIGMLVNTRLGRSEGEESIFLMDSLKLSDSSLCLKRYALSYKKMKRFQNP
jgi:hypothetical protein